MTDIAITITPDECATIILGLMAVQKGTVTMLRAIPLSDEQRRSYIERLKLIEGLRTKLQKEING